MQIFRHATLLLLVIFVAACERSTPEVNSTTVAAPAVAIEVPAPAPVLVPVDQLSVNVVADNIAYQEAAARVDGDALVSTGTAGFVMFGPYVTLAQGRYSVKVQGSIAKLPDGTSVIFDVVSKGQVFGEHTVTTAPEGTGEIAGFQFELAEPVADLEIRARVMDGSEVRIKSYDVTKI